MLVWKIISNILPFRVPRHYLPFAYNDSRHCKQNGENGESNTCRSGHRSSVKIIPLCEMQYQRSAVADCTMLFCIRSIILLCEMP